MQQQGDADGCPDATEDAGYPGSFRCIRSVIRHSPLSAGAEDYFLVGSSLGFTYVSANGPMAWTCTMEWDFAMA